MNAYPNGTRVFFWASTGEIKYGTVQSTSRLADGTQIVVVALDGGSYPTIPGHNQSSLGSLTLPPFISISYTTVLQTTTMTLELLEGMKCDFCRAMDLVCDCPDNPARSTSSVNQDPIRSIVTTEGYGNGIEFGAVVHLADAQPALADVYPQLVFTVFQSGPTHPPNPMHETEARGVVVVLWIPLANEPHEPISGPANVMQTPEGQLTSSASCTTAICRWREEGAPKVCGAVISCEGVPVHFKSTHAIKDMGASEPLTCRWDGCFASSKRKSFARHIRECHLNHSRDKGHSS